jgi:hypothetical protein
LLKFVTDHFESPDAALADTAISVAARSPRVIELCHEELKGRLTKQDVSPGTLKLLTKVIGANLGKPAAQDLITAMLDQPSRQVRRVAWQILGRQPGNVSNPAWISALDQSLAQSLTGPASADLPLLMDAIGKLGSNRFDQTLWRVIEDAGRPPPIRLKALAALSRPNEPLSNDAFALLFEMLKSGTSPTARVDAARLLTRVRLSKQQILELAPIVSTAAPIELQQLLRPMTRKLDVEAARIWARELIRSPYFGSLEESVIRSTFQSLSADIYRAICSRRFYFRVRHSRVASRRM